MKFLVCWVQLNFLKIKSDFPWCSIAGINLAASSRVIRVKAITVLVGP